MSITSRVISALSGTVTTPVASTGAAALSDSSHSSVPTVWPDGKLRLGTAGTFPWQASCACMGLAGTWAHERIRQPRPRPRATSGLPCLAPAPHHRDQAGLLLRLKARGRRFDPRLSALRVIVAWAKR